MANHSLHPAVVCAAVILHDPGEGITRRMSRMADIFGKLILVDNRSDPDSLRSMPQKLRREKFEWILNSDNLGVGKALNQAAQRARELSYTWMLALDQDSMPSENILEAFYQGYERVEDKENIGLLAPTAEHPNIDKPATFLRPQFLFFYERAACEADILENVSIAITSGSLINLEVHKKIGGFASDFFIDYIDTEYCLRCRQAGYDIVAVCTARLKHRLGSREEVNLGALRFYPTHHLPIRWYYISRNRIPMLRMYALKFPHWLSFEIISSVYIFLRMMLFEDHRWKKLKAIFYGTMDGLMGRMGKIRPEIEGKLKI